MATEIQCDWCDNLTENPENESGQILCVACTDNAAEKAWERHCMSSYDSFRQHKPR